MACDRVSAEMATEEGDEGKEDEEVEANVVKGGGFTTRRRRSGTVRVTVEAWEIWNVEPYS